MLLTLVYATALQKGNGVHHTFLELEIKLP